MNKEKMKLKDKIQFGVIIGIFAVIIGACVFSMCFNDMKVQAEEKFREFENSVSVTVPVDEKNKNNSSPESGGSYLYSHDVSVLTDQNNECVGWLSINGTSISYPIMQSLADHQKYLSRDFNGNYSFNGTPFLDYRCSLDSENMIIYGHHMNDGSMFGGLMNYENKSYRDSHPTIIFDTKSGVRKYTVFSVIKTSVNDDWYKFVSAESAEKFCKRVAYANEHSLYSTGLKPSMYHKLLTLSTCTNASDDERLLVIAYEN